MSVEDEFPIPPGDPAGLQAAGASLKRVAADVTRLGAGIRAEQAGMAGAWKGDAATAATAEATSLATITADKGGKVGEGAAAFTAFGAALETAVTAVREIRRQAHAADTDARAEANRTGRNLPYDDKLSLYTGLRDQALAPLRQRYRSVVETLDRAARTAATALTGAVPEYKTGMSPADVALRVRDATAAKLPSVLQLDGQRRGRELADKIRPILEKGDQIPPELLDQLEANRENPWFATTFLETLGPRMPLWAMTVMQGQGTKPDYNQRVIADFGQLLALGTRIEGEARLSQEYVDTLLAPLDQHNGIGLDAAWKLGHLLHYGGTFGTDFLTRAGDKLYGLDKAGFDTQQYTMVGGYPHRPLVADWGMPDDTMEAYFDAVAKDARAAQAFFAGHDDRLQYYVFDRRTDDYLGDHGESLGSALTAATTVFRNGDATGLTSATIATSLLRKLGDREHNFLAEHDREKLTPALGTILASYADDTYYTLSRQNQSMISVPDPSLPPGVTKGNAALGTGTYGISLTPAEIRQLLGQVDHDVAAYGKVIQAHLDAANRYLDADLKYIREHPGEKEDVLVRYGSGYGRVLDTLFTTHMQVQHDLGAEKDQQRGQKWLGVVSVANVIGSVVPFVVPGTTPLMLVMKLGFNVTAGASLPWLINGASSPANADAADAESVQKVNSWYLLNQYAQVDRIANGGAYAGTPADVGAWLRDNHIPPDASFLDGDGKIIPQDRLTEAQARAYLRWHVDESGHGVGQETSQLTDAIESQVRVDPPKVR